MMSISVFMIMGMHDDMSMMYCIGVSICAACESLTLERAED